MKKNMGSRQKGRKGPRKTTGRDNMASNTSRKDYFVANALELTPHPNQALRSVLGRPIMDRRFKYSTLESTLAGSSATSATPLNLVSINQGTTDVTRTGDRVRVKRLWLSGKVTGAAAAAGSITSRILVVLWNPPGVGNVNAPVSGQVIQHGATYGPYGPYSRDYGDAYQVVYDMVTNVNPVSTSSDPELFHLDREVTVDMEFSAGATSPAVNTLYLFHLTDSGVNNPTLVFSSTIWYEDLDA